MNYWWERKIAQPRWKAMWQFLKEVNIELSYDPPNLVLQI